MTFLPNDPPPSEEALASPSWSGVSPSNFAALLDRTDDITQFLQRLAPLAFLPLQAPGASHRRLFRYAPRARPRGFENLHGLCVLWFTSATDFIIRNIHSGI